MNIHQNARLTPLGRERLVRQIESGQTPEAAARAAGVCPRTARKWLGRFRTEGLAGLQDRSSRPHRLREPTPAATIAAIEAQRRQRFTGQQIAPISPFRRPPSAAFFAGSASTALRRWNRQTP